MKDTLFHDRGIDAWFAYSYRLGWRLFFDFLILFWFIVDIVDSHYNNSWYLYFRTSVIPLDKVAVNTL